METKIYDEKLIVVTGAAGFIASGVIRHLNDKGCYNLLLVDDIGKTEKWKNVQNKRFVDWIGIHELFEWIEKRERDIRAFIHLGACSDTVETNGDYFMQNNYRYSIRLAEYALEHDHRFIYASSAATYGNGSFGFSDSHEGLEKLRPLNMYGFSKHLFDLWLKEQGLLDRVVGLKYFNIFGPNEVHKGRMASMVYHMTCSILKDGKVRLFKSTDPQRFPDGDQCRDFMYVKDAVEITCSFLDNDLNGIYNVGRGEATTWNYLACAIFKALGREVNIEYIPTPPDLAKQYQNYTCADLEKYHAQLKKNSLPILPFLPLETQVKEYVCEYLLKDERW